MANLNRKCIICGKRYEYCGHCSNKTLAKETWRNIYCSEKCRDTFSVFEQYTAKKITADVAAQQLKDLGVDLNRVNRNFKKDIDSIETCKTKQVVKVEPAPVVASVENISEKEEKKPVVSKKRKKRKQS